MTDKLRPPSDRLQVDDSALSAVRKETLSRAIPASIRNWIATPLFSAVLLIPVFWQSRIQSADLSSHIYNAWLSSQIRQGRAPGLWIFPQSNNVLFDFMLEWLSSRSGPARAQQIAVSVSVLVFGWGAVLFTFRCAAWSCAGWSLARSSCSSGRADRRDWWFVAPCVAMLAYGFVFHMGFFNFYLSMGLCLWYFALFIGTSWRIRALAVPLLIVAWFAHPFPVIWLLGSAAYAVAANHLQPRQRSLLIAFGLAVLLAVRYILTHRYAYYWSINQVAFITGANQIALFGFKYVPPFAALVLIWLTLLRSLAKRLGASNLFSSIPFQLWLLNAAAVVLIPEEVIFPQYGRPFGYITQRLSFAAAVLLCAVLAAAPMTRITRAALAATAVLFFTLLYSDYRELNHREDQMDATVNRLPPGQRVISYIQDESLRSLCLYHQLDRACIGHCFSYGNYEASSKQFRIRAYPDNGIVLGQYADADAAADGRYVVQPHDVPLYLVYPCGKDFRYLCSRPLQPGETNGK